MFARCGISSQNNRRYISISELAAELGVNFSQTLHLIHTFSGCDFTASFLCKGMLKPILTSRRQTFVKVCTHSQVEKIVQKRTRLHSVTAGKFFLKRICDQNTHVGV